MNVINNWVKPIKKVRLMCQTLTSRTSTEPTDIARLEAFSSQVTSPNSLPDDVVHLGLSTSQATFPNIPSNDPAPPSYPLFAKDIPSSSMTPTQKEVDSTFKMLYRATNHQQSAEINEVLLNMELLAFGFTWFAQVCLLLVPHSSCNHFVL
jgi:hypothetical protein